MPTNKVAPIPKNFLIAPSSKVSKLLRSKHMYFDATWVLFEVSGVHITRTQWGQSLDEFALKDKKKIVIFVLSWVDLETKQPFSNGVLGKIGGKYFGQNSWMFHFFLLSHLKKLFVYQCQNNNLCSYFLNNFASLLLSNSSQKKLWNV